MHALVGWLIAALCVALFAAFIFVSAFVAVLGLRRPPPTE